MKCELAAALLHRPRLLLLDEPTLGLDVTAQDAVRRFLLDYRARHKATILLTSHYMADITALASRVLMINHGRLVFDGQLDDLVARTLARAGGARVSERTRPERLVDAAIDAVAASPSPLALVPVEDLLALDEAPNLPGTTTERPNWSLALTSPLEELMVDPVSVNVADALQRLDD